MRSKTTVILNFARSPRGTRLAALVAGLMITLAVPASADTIGISGGVLIVGTEPGDGNQVFAPTTEGLDLILPNLDADVVTLGCTDAGSITCPLAGFQELVILGGDGDDVIQLSGISGLTFPIIALGGPGNDVLVGTPGNVKLFGGPGDDVLINMPGNCFSRGTGSDIVLGGGCDAGPEPAFAPLPRPVAATPEPSGLLLVGTGLMALAVASRMSFRRGLTKRLIRSCAAPHPIGRQSQANSVWVVAVKRLALYRKRDGAARRAEDRTLGAGALSITPFEGTAVEANSYGF